MNVEVFNTYADLSQRAADIVADLIGRRPHAVLGLPTGSTPVGFYDALTKTGASFGQVQTFNLDEYVGLPKAHPESYYTFMHQHLISR
ncbi:MAG TPA: glucosamine-6-phosphate deaminase, partial [Symbiobacteriaceae bacterium]|nr:glucosamine-6-phosphate deaminase [Symbiobacteriaceae bacterium]